MFWIGVKIIGECVFDVVWMGVVVFDFVGIVVVYYLYYCG